MMSAFSKSSSRCSFLPPPRIGWRCEINWLRGDAHSSTLIAAVYLHGERSLKTGINHFSVHDALKRWKRLRFLASNPKIAIDFGVPRDSNDFQ